MEKWKQFEKNSAIFLNKNICLNGVTFEPLGASDSNACDIKVQKDDNLLFSIECKYCPAQSSQFVVKRGSDSDKFIFSEENRSSSEGAEAIIQHMNQNFSYYSQSSTSDTNLDLICDKSLMYDRVVKQLNGKSVFFAASNYLSNFSDVRPLVLDLISEIPNYFDITGKFRTKQSGTRAALEKHLRHVSGHKKIQGKFYIHDPHCYLENYHPNDQSIYLQAPNAQGYRALRKRSSVRNANVIFSLTLKDKVRHLDLKRFEIQIKKILHRV